MQKKNKGYYGEGICHTISSGLNYDYVQESDRLLKKDPFLD